MKKLELNLLSMKLFLWFIAFMILFMAIATVIEQSNIEECTEEECQHQK